MSDLGLVGSPMPLHVKWQIGLTVLSLSLEIVLEGADVKGPPCGHICLLPRTGVAGKGCIVTIHCSLQ